MKQFSEFSEMKQMATFLVDNDIDVDAFCEMVLKLAENDNLTEAALYNEFMGMGRGIAAAARGLAGVGNLAAAPTRWGAKKVGQGYNAAKQSAIDAGRAGMNKVNQFGQRVADTGRAGVNAVNQFGQRVADAGRAGVDAVNQAGQRVGQGAMDAGRAVGRAGQAGMNAVNSTMEAGRRDQAIRQSYDRVKMLYDSLGALGLDRGKLSSYLQPIEMLIKQQQRQSGQQAIG